MYSPWDYYYQQLYSVKDPNTGEDVPWNDNKRYGAIVNFNWAKLRYQHFDAQRAADFRVWKSNVDLARKYGYSEELIKQSYGVREAPRATVIQYNSKTYEITVQENAGEPLV